VIDTTKCKPAEVMEIALRFLGKTDANISRS